MEINDIKNTCEIIDQSSCFRRHTSSALLLILSTRKSGKRDAEPVSGMHPTGSQQVMAWNRRTLAGIEPSSSCLAQLKK